MLWRGSAPTLRPPLSTADGALRPRPIDLASAGARFGIGGSNHRVVCRQAPLDAILFRRQAIASGT